MPAGMTFTSLQADLRAYAERGYPTDASLFIQIPRLINNAERRVATELKIQGFVVPVTFSLSKGEPVYAKPDRWRETISINVGTAPVSNVVTRANNGALTATLTFDKPHPFVTGQQVLVAGMAVAAYNGSFFVTATAQLTISYTLLSNPGVESVADAGGASAIPNKRKPLFPRSYEYVRQYWPDDGVEGEPEFYADYDYHHVIIVPTPTMPFPAEWNYYELLQLLDDASQTNWLTDFAPNLLLYAALLELAPFLKNDDRIPVWQGAYDRIASGISQQDIAKIVDRSSKRDRT